MPLSDDQIKKLGRISRPKTLDDVIEGMVERKTVGKQITDPDVLRVFASQNHLAVWRGLIGSFEPISERRKVLKDGFLLLIRDGKMYIYNREQLEAELKSDDEKRSKNPS